MPRRAPAGLGARGRAFWRRTVGEYELTPAEAELLVEVCRVLDTCADLAEAIRADGTTVAGSKGQPRVHPAIAELRAQRLALGRLLGQLGLEDDDGAALPTPRSVRARKAAESRWAGHVKRSDYAS